MRTLVVYYSRTGITKKVAQKIALELKADIEELIDMDKRKGALGYLKSGREAMGKKLAVIETLHYNPLDYDLVIVGTPNWASTMASAVRTYLSDQKGKIKQAAFFVTQGSSGGEKVIRSMIELSGVEARAELVLTSKESVQDNYQEKFAQFIEKVK